MVPSARTMVMPMTRSRRLAVAVAEGAGVVGGEDAAYGGAVGPEGVEGYELAVLCEGLLKGGPCAAGWTVQVRSCQGCSDDLV